MADPRERFNDQDEATRLAVDRHLGTVWTALPVKILEDSKDGHVCKAQSTIKAWDHSENGSVKAVEMAHLGTEVPITFVQGGNFVITHPVKKDDEGICIIASRNITGWWDKGNIQAEPARRRHNLSDAMYIPGVRSKPRKLGGDQQQGGNGAAPQANGQDGQQQQKKKTKPPSTTSLQIRTEPGGYYIELTDTDCNIDIDNLTVNAKKVDGEKSGDGQQQSGGSQQSETVTINCTTLYINCKNATVTAEESVKINCKTATIKATDHVMLDSPTVEMTGDLKVHGEVTAKSQGGSVHLSTHRHTQVQGGLGISGPPQSGS